MALLSLPRDPLATYTYETKRRSAADAHARAPLLRIEVVKEKPRLGTINIAVVVIVTQGCESPFS